MTRRLLPLLVLFGACGKGGDGEETAPADTCEGLEWSTPEGVPGLSGAWTASFGLDFTTDTCTSGEFDMGDMTWIGAFDLTGSPPNALGLRLHSEDDTWKGVMDSQGGVSFTGRHEHPAGTIHAQLAGLAYHDPYRDKDVIDGAATLALDADGDGTIDCAGKGSWYAIKSGS